eukprot:12893706-Prorocentrum_lima.AAC.1
MGAPPSWVGTHLEADVHFRRGAYVAKGSIKRKKRRLRRQMGRLMQLRKHSRQAHIEFSNGLYPQAAHASE